MIIRRQRRQVSGCRIPEYGRIQSEDGRIARRILECEKGGDIRRFRKINKPGRGPVMLHQRQASEVVIEDPQVGNIVVRFSPEDPNGPRLAFFPAGFILHKVLEMPGK